jgi:hypothetical protein
MTVTTYQTLNFGANPFVLDGPSTLGSGVILPNFKLGHVSYGDSELECVYCKLTLAAATTLIPGQAYTIDDDYNATLLSTANSPRGSKVMILMVNAPPAAQQPAGTYFGWFVRAGKVPVLTNTLTPATAAGGLAETSTTAGTINTPAGAATVGAKLIVGLYYTKAPATFTASTTNGSALLTGPFTGVSIGSGPFVGQTITGTGIPGSTTIVSIQTYQQAGSPQGVISSITMSAAATATGSAVTITPTLCGEANVQWCYVDKTN